MRNKLLSAGYKTFKPSLGKTAQTAYQKRFRDEKGTKYFINIYEYDNSRYGIEGLTYEISLQSRKIFKEREFTINTEIFGFSDFDSETQTNKCNVSVEDIESLVDEYWTINKFEYYEED